MCPTYHVVGIVKELKSADEWHSEIARTVGDKLAGVVLSNGKLTRVVLKKNEYLTPEEAKALEGLIKERLVLPVTIQFSEEDMKRYLGLVNETIEAGKSLQQAKTQFEAKYKAKISKILRE